MIDTIELFIDEDSPGVFAISLVNTPAIESNFVALSKHDVSMKIVDAEKRIVTGLALIPEKEILRVSKDRKYNIKFSAETVRKASEIYLRELRNANTTYEHEMAVEGVYLAESWIVEDPERDKTSVHGIEAPKGSWAISMKVENDEVWEKIKEGEVLGFSIEGVFDETPVDAAKAKWEKIKQILEA